MGGGLLKEEKEEIERRENPLFITAFTPVPTCELCNDVVCLLERRTQWSIYSYSDGTPPAPVIHEDVYPSFPRLAAFSASGCQSKCCGFLRSCLLTHVEKRPMLRTVDTSEPRSVALNISTIGFRDSDNGETFQGRLHLTLSEGLSESTTFEIGFWFNQEPTPAPLSQDALCEKNIVLVKTWLQECDFAHALCISNRKGYRPTRLVQVTGDGSQLELTESEGLEESPHYIALSYCWGSHSGFSRSYQTTGQNLANRRISFLREELPQALLDAIDMARLLEVPYIWIDSLCIVQDDAQDWNEQASKMCDVFENAYITVAATSARNTAEGFLARRSRHCLSVQSQRRPKDQESHHAKTNSMNHVPYKFGPDYSVHGPIHFRFPHSPNTSASLVESTWNSRGWILQEQVLSTRILYFLDDIMLMDCVSAPIRVEDPGYARAATLRNPWSRRVIADITNSVATEGNPYGDWYSLMGIYAEKKLSFPEDKLPAISGLARKMIQTHGDFYLAGLWEGDFHRGLLWRPKDSSKMTRYAEYIAPTWSWMSICGITEWPFRTVKNLRNQLIVLDVELKASGDDPLGRLKAGQITVVGKIVSLKAIQEDFSCSNTRAYRDVDGHAMSDNTLALSVYIAEGKYFGDRAYGILIEPALIQENDVDKFCRVGSFHCTGDVFRTIKMKEVIIV